MPKSIRRRVFRTHPLDEYEDLVFDSRGAGYSYQSIQKILRSKGLSVDRSTVFRYVQSHSRTT